MGRDFNVHGWCRKQLAEEEATFQFDFANAILETVGRAEDSLQQSSRRKRRESHEAKMKAQAEAAEAEEQVHFRFYFALLSSRRCVIFW